MISVSIRFFRVNNLQTMYALSFYGFKMILERANHFGWVPIVLVGSKSFGTVPNNRKNSPEKSNLYLTKMIWTRPKRFGHDQNNLDKSKTIWTVQNHFGPIEGQGSRQQKKHLLSTVNSVSDAFILESVNPRYDVIVHCIPRKIQVDNMLCTKIGFFLFSFWHSKQYIFVHNMLSTCIFLGNQWTISRHIVG